MLVNFKAVPKDNPNDLNAPAKFNAQQMSSGYSRFLELSYGTSRMKFLKK